jgi:hypothetical protein
MSPYVTTVALTAVAMLCSLVRPVGSRSTLFALAHAPIDDVSRTVPTTCHPFRAKQLGGAPPAIPETTPVMSDGLDMCDPILRYVDAGGSRRQARQACPSTAKK